LESFFGELFFPPIEEIMPSIVEQSSKMATDAAKFPQLMKELESKIDEVQNQLKPILAKYVILATQPSHHCASS
jgi:hypothetical protein